MSTQTKPLTPSAHLHPRSFRHAAAGLIKSLIRARATQEPHFLTAKEYARWGVGGIEQETRPAAVLLTRVRQLLANFEEHFLPDRYSVSEPGLPEETGDAEILAEHVAGFIYGDLDEAIRIAASGKKVPWDRLADWSELTRLRDTLDRLSESTPTNEAEIGPVAQSSRVFLYGFKDKPVVNGKKKPVLKSAQYKLVKDLIEAGQEGHTKSQLERISSDYWHTLRALKESDDDWDQVIHFPGKGGRGYWIE